MSVKPKIRLENIKNRELPPIKSRTWKHETHKIIQTTEYETKQPQDIDELDMLINDLEYVKSKKSLECFITENKDFINNLNTDDRNAFLSYIKRKYFS